LGLTSVSYVEHNHTLAVTDIPLEGEIIKSTTP